MAAGVSSNLCSFLDTEVTLTLSRSSRFKLAKSRSWAWATTAKPANRISKSEKGQGKVRPLAFVLGDMAVLPRDPPNQGEPSLASAQLAWNMRRPGGDK